MSNYFLIGYDIDYCDEYRRKRYIRKIFKKALFIFQVIIPIILILIGIINLIKNIRTKKKEKIKKAKKRLIKIIIISLALFLLITSINIIFQIIEANNYNGDKYWNCLPSIR